MPVIGFLGLLTPEEFTLPATGYIQGLSQAGYVDGHNVKIEYRWAHGQFDQLPALAADLVRQQVTVVAALTTPPPRSPRNPQPQPYPSFSSPATIPCM